MAKCETGRSTVDAHCAVFPTECHNDVEYFVTVLWPWHWIGAVCGKCLKKMQDNFDVRQVVKVDRTVEVFCDSIPWEPGRCQNGIEYLVSLATCKDAHEDKNGEWHKKMNEPVVNGFCNRCVAVLIDNHYDGGVFDELEVEEV